MLELNGYQEIEGGEVEKKKFEDRRKLNEKKKGKSGGGERGRRRASLCRLRLKYNQVPRSFA